MYKKIVFDLDGTLTDSGRGILASVVYALENSDIPYRIRRRSADLSVRRLPAVS